MTIGAYRSAPHFAYPGWRLTIPGGPAGGHYKGFTHNYSAGTAIDAGDEYEADRGAGASSHDAVHATPRNPRGVYRSSGEVPPRPNASGSAHTYTGHQTMRHAGTSVAPGSFPAPYSESDEDSFLSGLGLTAMQLRSDGVDYAANARAAALERMVGLRAPIRIVNEAPIPSRPNTIAAPSVSQIVPGGVISWAAPPSTGATSVVNQPPPVLVAPAPAVANVPAAPPVSPAPAPVVASPVVVPASDGSGNYIRISDGTVVPGNSVYQNPATGQLQTAAASTGATPSSVAGVEAWLAQNSIWSAVPNWALLAGVGVMLFAGKGGRR